MTHLANKLLTHWTVNLGLYQGGPSEQLLLGASTSEHAIGTQLDDMVRYRLANRSIQEQHVQSKDLADQNTAYLQFKMPTRGTKQRPSAA